MERGLRLYITGMPIRKSMTGYEAKGTVTNDNDDEVDVVFEYDYEAAEKPQGNPDLPNPGPGRDEDITLTSIRNINDGTEIDPSTVSFDLEKIMDVTKEVSGLGLKWYRRMAGL